MTHIAQRAIRFDYSKVLIAVVSLCLIFFVAYVSSLVTIAYTLSLEKNIKKDISSLKTELAQAQNEYLSLEETVTKEFGASMSLVAMTNITFAKAPSLASK